MHPRSFIFVALLLAAGASQAARPRRPVRAGRILDRAAAAARPRHRRHRPRPRRRTMPAPAAPPPAPPPLPAIPAEAHAACAGKANGSKLTFTPAPGETMHGVCKRVDGRMVFQLRSYHRD